MIHLLAKSYHLLRMSVHSEIHTFNSLIQIQTFENISMKSNP